MLDVTLLGTGGTMPQKDRWLASALLRYNGSSLLIDCGEGTQISLMQRKLSFKAIDIMLITHFHADHISGLPGFLLSMGNNDRTEPLTIIAPRGLSLIVESLLIIAPHLPFELNLIELSSNVECFSMHGYTITAFALKHTLPCYGYSIEIPRTGKFDVEKANKNHVPLEVWSSLQRGNTITCSTGIFTPDMVIGEARKGIKFTYCTDTRPTSLIEENARNSNLFVCEGMFGSDTKENRATITGHMTFTEAAHLAKNANVGCMWLTHYSPSLPKPEEYLCIARAIFSHTKCGVDGMTTTISFDDLPKKNHSLS